jgi:hypothetical protein
VAVRVTEVPNVLALRKDEDVRVVVVVAAEMLWVRVVEVEVENWAMLDVLYVAVAL